ncbi:MAG: ABC transporter permease [Acidobacteriaceae bacterium]
MRSTFDIFGQVFQAIWANKLRSFLTMFGIAWGVASLLLLIGLGEGFRSGQRRELAELGKDIIMAWSGTIPALPNQHTGMRPYKLTYGDEQAVRLQAPHIRAATATLSRADIRQVSAFSNAGGTVLGVEANYPQVRTLEMDKGRFLDAEDEREARKVVVLGPKSESLLFMGHPAVGSYITLNGSRFLVIGVAKKGGRGNNDGQNQQLYIPLTTMFELFPLKGENIPADALTSIQYQPIAANLNETAKAEFHRVIAERHGFDPGMTDAFEEWDTIKSEKTVGLIFDAMDVFLGGVGVVTLMLGAVGIINIMLVTVTERTQEIGLRKALGATNRSILMQFFLEGLLLTGLSGAIGIIGSAAFMVGLSSIMGPGMQGFDPPRLVPWSAAMAMGTLTLCGIVAGIYPARKAAMLEPVEALRKE